MLKRKNSFFVLSLFILFLSNCTTYSYSILENASDPETFALLKNYKPVITFGDEQESGKQSRKFRIEKKITWFIFDLWNIQEFNMLISLKEELPNAKKIYNLRIESKEGGSDSLIRLLSTGIQIGFVPSAPFLFSRRTVILAGDVVE